MKTGTELLEAARAACKHVSPEQVMDMQRRGEPITLLDVRDLHEVNLGKIPGAVHVSRGNLETKVEAQVPRDKRVIVYCASGNRSTFAALLMEELGYENAASMDGGFRGWVEAGGDVD